MLCLDLLNTVNAWPAPTRDDLTTPGDLDRWAADGGLPLAAPATPDDVAAARLLRDQLLHVFTPLLVGQAPAGSAVEWLLHEAAVGRPASVELETGRLALRWYPPLTADELRSSVAFSAVSLLLQGPLGRVNACATCGWFFLDTSRNGSRPWCSMQYCGSQAKARTYADKQRAAATKDPGRTPSRPPQVWRRSWARTRPPSPATVAVATTRPATTEPRTSAVTAGQGVTALAPARLR